MPRMPSVVALLLALAPRFVAAQQPAGTPADAYLTRYHELTEIVAAKQGLTVHHLVLTRDVGTLTLENGVLYPMGPVGGRPVAAFFQGSGRFVFRPTLPTEAAEVKRALGDTVLDDSLSEAVLVFADSTADVLQSLPGTGNLPDAADHVRDALKTLEGKNEGSFDEGAMEPVLNGERNGFFLARLKLSHAGDVLFKVDPAEVEGVQLRVPARRVEFGVHWSPVAAEPARDLAPDTMGSWHYRPRLDIPAYRLDVNLHDTFTADLDFSADATLTIRVLTPVGPWVHFALEPKILVDSARWSDGTLAPVFKAKDDSRVWVRAPRRLATGDSLTLTLHYHADHPDLIDRFSSWFFLDPGADWYPVNGEGREFATFDMTYHYPFQYPLASVGARTDSSRSGKIVTTHWVLSRPSDFATFNLGAFDDDHIQPPGEPALDVMISEGAHREFARRLREAGYVLFEQSHMREAVAADVSNSLKFYTFLFGAPPYSHYYVTEIPYSEGVSFPGLIDLSMFTFQTTQLDGSDDLFRAHEVAHQWWGNGVEQASYRDKWLTEGLAEFSGLWYLAAERKSSDGYFKFLDHYRDDILGEKDDVGPTWVGFRSATFKVPHGYQTMIYEKGAWIFHMLRIMMLDLKTMNEDRFTATMKDYYQTFQGKPATTADFQGVVERHAGIQMDWFFNEWVKGTAIPTYHVAWTNQPGDNGATLIKLRITQEHVGPDFQMPVLFAADLGQNRVAHFRLMISGNKTEYQSPSLPAGAKKVTVNDLHSVLADVKMESW